jgi:SAM-dependent methyltransferase
MPEPTDPTAGSRWAQTSACGAGRDYAERFRKLASSGVDVHGEARFCDAAAQPGSRILDAGCGTGRVAIRLAELGHRCVGVDSDSSMLAVAREANATVRWVEADLADLGDVAAGLGLFDIVVAAGNVIPLLAPGTESTVVHQLAERLVSGGVLVAGFGLDEAHLPIPAAPFGLAEYDAWCAVAGLQLTDRHATWEGDLYDGGGYAVSVHRKG